MLRGSCDQRKQKLHSVVLGELPCGGGGKEEAQTLTGGDETFRRNTVRRQALGATGRRQKAAGRGLLELPRPACSSCQAGPFYKGPMSQAEHLDWDPEALRL